MVKNSFNLVGAPASKAQDIEIDLQNTFEALQHNVAQHFSIAQPKGIFIPTSHTRRCSNNMQDCPFRPTKMAYWMT